MNWDELKKYSEYLQKEFNAPDFLSLMGKHFAFIFLNENEQRRENCEDEYKYCGQEVLIGTIIGIHIDNYLSHDEEYNLPDIENHYRLNLKVKALEIDDGTPDIITGWFYSSETEDNEKCKWMLSCL